jgi:hypothetical protein
MWLMNRRPEQWCDRTDHNMAIDYSPFERMMARIDGESRRLPPGRDPTLIENTRQPTPPGAGGHEVTTFRKPVVDVRVSALSGLKSDIGPCPKNAIRWGNRPASGI